MPNRTLALSFCAIWLGTAVPQTAYAETTTHTGMAARGTRIFYEAKKPGADAPDLRVRDGSGTRNIIDGSAQDGAVKAFLASPDGDKVAVLLVRDNTTALSVYDATTANRIAGPIAIDGDIAGWSKDARTLYFASRKTGTLRLMGWDLRSAPETVQIYDATIVSLALRDDEVFLLSGKNASARKLLAIRTGSPSDRATELVATRPGRTLQSMYPAADAIYVLAREGSYLRMLRIPAKANGHMQPTMPPVTNCRNCRSFPALRFRRISVIALPDGTISAVFTDPQTPGFSIVLDHAGAAPEVLRYVPSTGNFASDRTMM